MNTRTVISLCAILVLLSLRAQEPVKTRTWKNEAGFNFYTMGLNPPDSPPGFFGGMLHQFTHGIYYRREIGNHALRLKLNHFRVENSVSMRQVPMMPGFPEPKNYQASQGKLGYQYTFGSKKISFYLLADLGYRTSKSEVGGGCPTCFEPAILTHAIPEPAIAILPVVATRQRTETVGLTKGLGLMFRPSDRISLNLESSWEHYVKQTTFSNNIPRNTETATAFYPLQVMLGFRL